MTLRQGQVARQHDAHTSAIAGSAPAAARQAAADFLGSETAVLSKALVGYARVSTCAQRLDRQSHALEAAGCIRIFADKLSGKNTDREELTKALDHLRSGDTLVVPSLDRLARSLADLITIVTEPRRLPVPEGSPQHRHPRRPPRLPRLRRARRIHPRAHRGRHL
ncbi:recombinase family protein [Streptosporangium sp. NPDC020145]|uniref:recombinase family protein n=1 Tax=Streptosporangium sp. NPDC020145 TaxID=3154694 RepID=UPI00343D84B7